MTKTMIKTLMYATMFDGIMSPPSNTYNGIKNGLYVDTKGKIDLEHKLSKRQLKKRKARLKNEN